MNIAKFGSTTYKERYVSNTNSIQIINVAEFSVASYISRSQRLAASIICFRICINRFLTITHKRGAKSYV